VLIPETGGERMSSKETDLIRDLLLGTESDIIKYLFNLDQSFNADELEHLLDGKEKALQPFTKVFPELMNVYSTLQERSDYLKQNPSVIINWLSYNKKDQALKDYNKSIKQAHLKFRKRIRQAKSIAQDMGLDLFNQGTPDLTSSHYQVAYQAAQLLCSKWFINKVYLFGSVSRGHERPDSDIDLALCRVTKRNLSPIETLTKQCIESVHEEHRQVIPKALCNRTNTMFDVVNYSKKLIDSGHLKDAILLAENKSLEVRIGKELYIFEKTSLIKQYSFSESTYTGIMQSLVYPLDGERYQNLLIKDDLPIAYRIIRFEVDEVGYIRWQTLSFKCSRKYKSSEALFYANHLLFKAIRPMQPKQTARLDDEDG
jgi:predicted nucleotidyltransferase